MGRIYDNVCAICGGHFTSVRYDVAMCSAKCRMKKKRLNIKITNTNVIGRKTALELSKIEAKERKKAKELEKEAKKQEKRLAREEKLKPVNCEVCNATIIKTRDIAIKYCSNKCKNKAHTKLKEKKDIECVVCGTFFKSHQSAAKYCSTKCKNRRKTKQVRCRVCKVKFHRKPSAKSVYCSKDCENVVKPIPKGEIKALTEFKMPKITKLCVTCKQIVVRVKYCSDKCNTPKQEAKKAYKHARKRQIREARLSVESWGDIAEFIASRPSEEYHLDHIVPLNNENVCGLHNTWNFQWLKSEENVKKSNSFDGTRDNKGWERVVLEN